MESIALQLHTFRALDLSFAGKLALARQTGYSAVEVVPVGLPGDEAEAADALRQHGVEVVAAHMRYEPLRADWDRTLAYHRAIGNSRIVIVAFTLEEMGDRSSRAWQHLGSRLDETGARLQAEGFELGVHNHLLEMREVNGRPALEWLIGAARPENLFVELDLAWVHRAGLDPVGLLKALDGRCRLVHVKEPMANTAPPPSVTEAVPWTQEEFGAQLRAWHPHEPFVGEGVVDWSVVYRAAVAVGVEQFIVEHEGPGNPEEAARAGYTVLRRLGGA